MSSLCDHESPWLFHRDEIDLFEDEYEQLLARARRIPHRALRQIIEEQEATEERAQGELEIALAPFNMAQAECPLHAFEASVEELSVEELLEPASSLDELSALAHAWSRSLREQVCEGTGEEKMEEMRVRMNAPLVVAKCTFAAEEQAIGDAPAIIIADKELELAQIYLKRTLQALDKLAKEEHLAQAFVHTAMRDGGKIARVLQRRRDALKR